MKAPISLLNVEGHLLYGEGEIHIFYPIEIFIDMIHSYFLRMCSRFVVPFPNLFQGLIRPTL